MVTSPHGYPASGRSRGDDRAIFDGLIWLARTGAQWSQLPSAFGPKSTVHERVSEWMASGVLERAWAVLLQADNGEVGLDWSWQAADGCIVKAPFGQKGGLARRRFRGATPPIGTNPAPSATC